MTAHQEAPILRRTFLAVLVLVVLAPLVPALPVEPAVVNVGTSGNEPQVVVAPDGTIYVGALQHVYRSVNGGASFQLMSTLTMHLSLASDSALSVDPSGRLYYAADWPYAGITETCTTTNRALSWSCDHVVVPGGTDRMWIHAPTTSAAFLVTNEGLYQPIVMKSADAATTWLPMTASTVLLSPQTGPLLTRPGTTAPLYQVIKSGGLALAVYPELGVPTVRATHLPAPHALPSMAFASDGALFAASEEKIGSGWGLVVARSTNNGLAWTNWSVPTPGIATVDFAWIAAGAPGHVGVVFYGSATAADPESMPVGGSWDAWFAQSRDANAATPTWTMTKIDPAVHAGPVCIAVSCSNRFAGDFITATIDGADVAHAVWMKDGATPTIRYARP